MAIARVIQESVLGCSSIAFDEHALQRMTERNVSEEEVIEVLKNPDRTGLPTAQHRYRYRKTLASRAVDIIFEHDPTQVVVITVIA